MQIPVEQPVRRPIMRYESIEYHFDRGESMSRVTEKFT
jgi:hypothetical protein